MGSDLDFDFIKEQELFFGKGSDADGVPDDGAGAGSGKGTDADVEALFAKKRKELPCESCNGKWHLDKGKGLSSIMKRHPEAEKEEEPSGGDQDVEPCEICNGLHKICPLMFELPCGPIPDINPRWYVACKCCYAMKFEEKTADCASCGSWKKLVFKKMCWLCWGIGHLTTTT